MTEFSDAPGKPQSARRIAFPESEEQLRLLIETLQDYAIFTLDTQGRVSSWNIGAERIQGYGDHEIIGKHFSVFYPQEDLRSGEPWALLETVTKEGHVQDEGWRVRKDGSRFWASILITALKDDSGAPYGFSKVTRDITETRKAQEALEQSNAALEQQIAEKTAAQQKLEASERSLRELSGQLLRMQDQERGRLGRELHDTIGQYLGALKMGLEVSSARQSPGRSAWRMHSPRRRVHPRSPYHLLSTVSTHAGRDEPADGHRVACGGIHQAQRDSGGVRTPARDRQAAPGCRGGHFPRFSGEPNEYPSPFWKPHGASAARYGRRKYHSRDQGRR
jgi:PAS domain S-box-containing protein